MQWIVSIARSKEVMLTIEIERKMKRLSKRVLKMWRNMRMSTMKG